MQIRAVGSTALSILLLAPVVSTQADITRQPYVQTVTQTGAVIMWESDTNNAAVIAFGTSREMGRRATGHPIELKQPAEPLPGSYEPPPTQAHVFEVPLTGLPPGRRVFYQVRCGGVRSAVYAFRTAPRRPAPFTFVAYGDSRSNPDRHARIGERIRAADPALILHTGDFVSSGGKYPQWTEQFFRPLGDLISRVPVWPVIGNHEGDGLNYANLFSLPGDERTYSFDYSNAHVVALDSLRAPTPEMLDWLRQDLAASRADWKVVFYHVPTYNPGGHASRWARDVLPPILREGRVDLVFAGHSHVYERTKPLRPSDRPQDQPITYVVTGGGGAPLYDLQDANYLAAKAKLNHICIVRIAGRRLTMTVQDVEGNQIDSLVIAKTGGRYNPEYEQAIFPEEQAE